MSFFASLCGFRHFGGHLCHKTGLLKISDKTEGGLGSDRKRDLQSIQQNNNIYSNCLFIVCSLRWPGKAEKCAPAWGTTGYEDKTSSRARKENKRNRQLNVGNQGKENIMREAA